MTLPVPPALRRLSSEEYAPLPWRLSDRQALARLAATMPDQARRVSAPLRAYVETRRGTAATLRAIDAAAGGGYYDVPAEAVSDAEAANAAFDGDGVVIDVQTHMVNPGRTSASAAEGLFGFLRTTDPDRWSDGIDPELIAAPQWASLLFGGSETAVALLSSLPSPPDDNVLTNVEIAAVREIVDRYAGAGRVLTHTIVHPNLGPREIEAMAAWRAELQPSAWKVYTLWEPPGRSAPGGMPTGWFLDDDEVGFPFLEQVRAVGPRIVCAHKGIGGPIPNLAPAGSSPRDVGPAASAFPDITFIVYHSGYDPDPEREEGAHRVDPQRGVSRLVTSLDEHGIGPGDNVYAELGTTWFLLMRRPREAAHVLGKLLTALGEDRILWGTDSIWYGAPQFMIDAFRAFTIPERMQEEFGYPPLTRDAKSKILGANAAAVYGIDVDALPRMNGVRRWFDDAAPELAARIS